MKPDFIDNRNGNTLQRALLAHLAGLRASGSAAEALWIATAYFNPEGLDLLADETARVPYIRLLLGAEPTPEPLRPVARPGDPDEPEFTRREVGRAIGRLNEGLRRDRDLLPFDPQADAAIRRLIEFLRSGRIEVRLVTGKFLHAKAFIVPLPARGFISGSSNLTRAGLRSNLELNLGQYDVPVVDKVESWYEELWNEAEPYDLAAVYEQLLVDFPPYLIYLRVLWELYGAELTDEAAGESEIPVTTFQKHGIWRALKIIEQCGGAIVADSVGLGKTFIAGEIMRLYRSRRQRVLLVCPAALRDGTWQRFRNRFQLYVDCVSFEELANDVQLGGEMTHLPNPLEDYALVVVDEAHHYRNPDTPMRAGVLRKLLQGPRRDLLLISATPVNNSLWDLYHQLRFFIKQDALFADRGVLSIRKRFEDAMRVDPFDLSPDLLYPIIDATTVKRTRQFVKKHYEHDLIRGPDGTLQPIRFPRPVASSLAYSLDEVLPGFLARLEAELMPASGSPALTLARYQPEHYPAGKSVEKGDSALVGLIRSGLLKRFESSVFAMRRTIERLVAQHELFLDGLARGKVLSTEVLREISATEEDADLEELIHAQTSFIDVGTLDRKRLRTDVQADLEILRGWLSMLQQVRAKKDPKLERLADELARIVREAEEQGIDAEDARQRRKVLVFSQYEETIDWIAEYLGERMRRDDVLTPYRKRMAAVVGDESKYGVRRDDAIFGFAPVSTEAPLGRDGDVIDLLLSTDVLAEGLNLQQCRNIINFDLPWNPMRLVQRHGRVDRIGSPHKEVYLRTFFPDRELERLLALEGRIRRKLAQAAASVGVETSPIEGGAEADRSFTETRTEIEKLAQNNSSIYERGGTQSAAQSGEEYRQELRKALAQQKAAILSLPWKAGSGVAKGVRPGHFFCAKVGERVYLRFVPAEANDAIEAEIGTCLRLIECEPDTPRTLPINAMVSAYGAWTRAREHIYAAWMHETDPANTQPKLRPLNERVSNLVQRHPPAELSEDRVAAALAAIAAPWSRREENAARAVFEAQYPSESDRAFAVIQEVERLGIEPLRLPDPLPPIRPEDIHLVVWLAIS